MVKHVVGGSLGAANFSISVKKDGVNVAGSPAAGSETGKTYTVQPGTYTISEAPVANYVASYSGECVGGMIYLSKDANKTCTITNTYNGCVPSTELCDGKDNDCDGSIDEDFSNLGASCSNGVGECQNSGIYVCSISKTSTVCNVNPGTSTDEICDGKDNNCNGIIDDGLNAKPADNILGLCEGNTLVCSGGDWVAAVGNYLPSSEICNGLDDDCDGDIDEGGICGTTTYYCDNDNDGQKSVNASGFCSGFDCVPAGCSTTAGTDCNDSNNVVYSGAPELCDGLDNDCDAFADEGVGRYFYQDHDGDGYGDSGVSQMACAAPSGYVENSTDCDDFTASVHPGATEICNGIDDDCDGKTDNGLTFNTYYLDFDFDGFGDLNNPTQSCSAVSGYVSNYGDCNDRDKYVNPGASEICDGIDNNCDDTVDEGLETVTYYRDNDGDGYGAGEGSTQCAVPGEGYATNNEDCDDTDPNKTTDCSDSEPDEAVNGVCGDSNGGIFMIAPTDGLCETGEATEVSGQGPWTWSCLGANGGTNADCEAEIANENDKINGVCGSADGNSFKSAPKSNLCNAGNATDVIGDGPWTWTCVGSNGGKNADCQASKKESSGGTVWHWSHPGGDRATSGGSKIKPQVAGVEIDLDEIERLINEIREKINLIAAQIPGLKKGVLGAATEVKTGVLD